MVVKFHGFEFNFRFSLSAAPALGNTCVAGLHARNRDAAAGCRFLLLYNDLQFHGRADRAEDLR
jgi:hypothetical protein